MAGDGYEVKVRMVRKTTVAAGYQPLDGEAANNRQIYRYFDASMQGRNRVVVRYGISVPFFGAPKAPHPNCFFFYENLKDTEKNLETSKTKKHIKQKNLN